MTSWLEAQVYAEMLSSLLRPVEIDGGSVFMAPIGGGCVPLMPLGNYGALVKWVLANPETSVGRRISGAPYVTNWTNLAKAFSFHLHRGLCANHTDRYFLVAMLTRISWSAGYLLRAPKFEAGAMWKLVSSRQTDLGFYQRYCPETLRSIQSQYSKSDAPDEPCLDITRRRH